MDINVAVEDGRLCDMTQSPYPIVQLNRTMRHLMKRECQGVTVMTIEHLLLPCPMI